MDETARELLNSGYYDPPSDPKEAEEYRRGWRDAAKNSPEN
jgi:hypothetical protein